MSDFYPRALSWDEIVQVWWYLGTKYPGALNITAWTFPA